MKKEWYINIEGKIEGPYSTLDLRYDLRITPATLVWKEGFEKWVPIGSVAELKDVFKDPEEASPQITQNVNSDKNRTQNELVLDYSGEPPDFLWLLVIILVLIYFLIQLYWV